MNALKINPRKSSQIHSVQNQTLGLKYLSNSQRRKSDTLTKDWKFFTYGLFGEMINKI